jgi:hypothetical protein
MAEFKNGDSVKYVVPDIIGTVKGARLDDDLNIEVLIEYKSKDGETHQRYFKEAELVRCE